MDTERLKIFEALKKGLEDGTLIIEPGITDKKIVEMSVVPASLRNRKLDGYWVGANGNRIEFSGKDQPFVSDSGMIFVGDDEMLTFTPSEYSAILDNLSEAERQRLHQNLPPKEHENGSE